MLQLTVKEDLKKYFLEQFLSSSSLIWKDFGTPINTHRPSGADLHSVSELISPYRSLIILKYATITLVLLISRCGKGSDNANLPTLDL